MVKNSSTLDKRLSTAEKLRLFDAATKRQQEREQRLPAVHGVTDRGWTRDELYERGTSCRS